MDPFSYVSLTNGSLEHHARDPGRPLPGSNMVNHCMVLDWWVGAAVCGSSDLLWRAGACASARTDLMDHRGGRWSTRCCCHRFSKQSLSYWFPSMLKRPVNDYAPERELVMGLLHGNSLHDFLGIHQCQHVTPRMPAIPSHWHSNVGKLGWNRYLRQQSSAVLPTLLFFSMPSNNQ